MKATGGNKELTEYLSNNFEKALSEGWIEVYYQPIVRTSNGKVCGEEALVRWHDPTYGELMPRDFVPALEAAELVYQLDLFVLDNVLEKNQEQIRRGLFVVPTSVNVSVADFFVCDMVREIERRVNLSKISRNLIALEILEGAFSLYDGVVIKQITRLRNAGYQIWLDNYGSGHSSPVLLQKIKFDMLKINRYLIAQILDSESARIILTELIKLALSLHMDVVAEGVEYREQVEFLKEIGCSMLQGFYYCKPISLDNVLKRYEDGTAIGFENPEESSYYTAIGRINIYDLSFANSTEDGLGNYFDTLPVTIVEAGNDYVRIIRGNKSFRDFFVRNFKKRFTDLKYKYDDESLEVGQYTLNTIRKSAQDGNKRVIDDRLKNGRSIQILVQRIAVNPVTGLAAVAIIILSVIDKQAEEELLSYNYLARALSEDYINLYYVNMKTGDFTEYNPNVIKGDVAVERKGEKFFENMRYDAMKYVVDEDRDLVISSLSPENMKARLAESGIYSFNYRLLLGGEPTYVSLKVVSAGDDSDYVILGVNNIDRQMKQREEIERIKKDQVTYKRLMALSGDFICIYTVDPETEHYVRYVDSNNYSALSFANEGDNFFTAGKSDAERVVVKDDLQEFRNFFTKENVMNHINESGLYVLKYRVQFQESQLHVCLKATMVEEDDGPKILVGIIDIEDQYELENQYTAMLMASEEKAMRDQLTGVKNKRAYVDAEEYINVRIKTGMVQEFAVVICDLNGLKDINDNLGHQEGDEYIRQGCAIICKAFAHSPVYRIGGDEFAVIAQGDDYDSLEECIGKINAKNRENKKKGRVTMAVGKALFEGDSFVSDVFERADSDMYKNKKRMKEGND
ncbi:MAG: GGDEF domain-containing protein [Pseudobutyrivibrio sp.]|nr:GGDEF domain-containing protein [Pseudobutyrivibrio sp.]